MSTYRSVPPQIPDDAGQRGPAALHGGEVSPARTGFRIERLVLEEGLAEIPAPARGQMGRIGRIHASRAVISVTLSVLQAWKRKREAIFQREGGRVAAIYLR